MPTRGHVRGGQPIALARVVPGDQGPHVEILSVQGEGGGHPALNRGLDRAGHLARGEAEVGRPLPVHGAAPRRR